MAKEIDYKNLLDIWFEMLENWDCGFMRSAYQEGAYKPEITSSQGVL